MLQILNWRQICAQRLHSIQISELFKKKIKEKGSLEVKRILWNYELENEPELTQFYFQVNEYFLF